MVSQPMISKESQLICVARPRIGRTIPKACGREYHFQPRVMGAHARLMRLFFLLASACMQAKQGSKTFAAPARKKRKCQHVP